MDLERATLDVIEQLSQTVLQPETWAAALASAIALVNGDHAILLTNRASAMTNPFAVAAGLSDRDIARFASPAARHMVEPLERRLVPGQVISSTEYFSDLSFEDTEFYNEIVRPANGFHAVTVQQEQPDLAFHFSACRARNARAFTSDEAHRVAVLLPHITVALQLRSRMQINGYRSRGLSEALDRLTEGAIVLDRSGRPLIVNARASRVLEHGDGLAFAFGRLRAATQALTARLHQAIAATAAASAGESQSLNLPRSNLQLPLMLTLTPIWRLQSDEPGSGAPSVLIFIRQPDARPDLDRESLEDIFRLTSRESEIAALLADGATARMIATRLELTIGTVRFNLKRIFQKTGTNSQSSLAALLRTFARHQPPVR
jgi:DNA-binding CsgD family transcriptional regulator/PAS domain-containing protein